MQVMKKSNKLQILLILILSIIRSSHQAVYTCDSNAECGCSTNSATVNRIVGGEEARPATWGWAVSLSMSEIFLCGGSIISDSWIVTAAHCVDGFSAADVTVYAGSNVVWAGSQTRQVSRVFVHSDYDSDTSVYDIALLQLASPLSMNDPNVSQICLPSVSNTTLASGEWPPVGTSLVAVGWGRMDEEGDLPDTLRQVTVQAVRYNATTCTRMFDWQIQFCAGISGGGKDTCQGDSGGPLMWFNSNNQWELVGVTSNGIGCARPTDSGVYTRVAAFKDWIDEIMENPLVTVITTTTTTTFPPLPLYANTLTTSIVNIFLISLFILSVTFFH